MAHRLTEDEVSRFHEAFTNWDISGDGTIFARDLCRVMESLGETPSRIIRKLSERPDAEDERFTFDEFLTITVGPPWEATGPDSEELLTYAMEEYDDGSGYVPLRDLMRIVQEFMERRGYHLTDGDLLDVYRHTLDGSLFAAVGGRLAPERYWKVFEDEFADFRQGHRMESVESAMAGEPSLFPTCSARKCCDLLARLRFANVGLVKCFRQSGCRSVDAVDKGDRAGDDSDSTSETLHMISLTVVDIGGNQLMVDAVASTWSVPALKQHIETVVGVSAHRQLLFLTGDDGFERELCPDAGCLSKAGVMNDSTLLLAVKDELKLDYKSFVSRFMDLDFDHMVAGA